MNKEDLKRWIREAKMEAEFPQHRAHGAYGNPRIDKKKESICEACGIEFKCDLNEEDECWCHDSPKILEIKSQNCLCKDCLEEKINEKQFLNEIKNLK